MEVPRLDYLSFSLSVIVYSKYLLKATIDGQTNEEGLSCAYLVNSC